MAFEMIQNQLKDEFTYELYLCKSSHPYDTIGCLTNAITDTAFNWILREPDELTFIIHEKFEDGTTNNLFTEIAETNTIKVDKIIDDVIIESYLYHISNIEPVGGISNSKNIKAYSLEIRLNKQTVRAFEYSTQIYTGAWDVNNPATSGIVDYILTLFEGNWTVNYVSASLVGSVRKFDITQSKCLEAIRIIEDNFNCIFMYDTVNQQINIVAYDDNYNGFNDNSGLILDNMNYLEQYNSQIDVDDIVTRLTIEGDKDANIASLNITGKKYIDDFSFFKNTKYMTQGLIDALDTLDALKTSNTATYQGLLTTLATKQGEKSTLQGELFTLETELIIIEDSEDLAIRNGGTYNSKTYAQWHSDLLAKQAEITAKEGEIITKQSEIDSTNTSIDNLHYLVSYDNPANLTNAQRKELVNFIQEDTQNINSDDPDVLLELGQAYMNIKANSQYDISVNMVDVFSVKDESYTWDKLVLGSKVNLIINDVTYEPIITSINHSPDNNSLNITVSNKLYLNDDMNYLTDLWAKTNRVSKVVDKNTTEWKETVDKANTLEEDATQPIDTSENIITISSSVGEDLVQQAQLNRRGLYTGGSLNANSQLKIIAGLIVFTNDNWASHSVAIDSSGIRTTGAFRLFSDGVHGGNNLVTIDGSKISIHGDGTETSGIEIFNQNDQKVMGFDGSGNLTMTGKLSIVSGSSGIGSFSDAGALATKDSVDFSTSDVINKTADYIQESITRKWAAESGADVTGLNISAGFNGQGALATLNQISETHITNEAITTPKIATGAIVADKISVSELSAITANLGTVNAGTINGITITGSTIRTNTSGERIELNANTLTTYNSSDELDGIQISKTLRRMDLYLNDIHQGYVGYSAGNIWVSSFTNQIVMSATDNNIRIRAGSYHGNTGDIFLEGNVNFSNANLSGLSVEFA